MGVKVRVVAALCPAATVSEVGFADTVKLPAGQPGAPVMVSVTGRRGAGGKAARRRIRSGGGIRSGGEGGGVQCGNAVAVQIYRLPEWSIRW